MTIVLIALALWLVVAVVFGLVLARLLGGISSGHVPAARRYKGPTAREENDTRLARSA